MHLTVSIAQQRLQVFSDDSMASAPLAEFAISSGLNGTGCEKHSGKTPLGRHQIRAKIGAHQPINTVFVGRRPTGEVYSEALAEQFPNRDWILTRILWLSGLETGVNRLGTVDSMQRYIYIHGTPDSEPMGVAKSHGCIRMRNQDVVTLFDWVDAGTVVEIKP